VTECCLSDFFYKESVKQAKNANEALLRQNDGNDVELLSKFRKKIYYLFIYLLAYT
jgi:hypothetical protein